MDYSFPKNERLSGSKSIGRLFAKGESGFVYPFRYLFIINDEKINDNGISSENDLREQIQPSGTNKIAMLVSVPKHYQKRAYKRNLVKRRTREAFRKYKHDLKRQVSKGDKKIDIALIYSTKNITDYKTVENAVAHIIKEISKRC